MTDDKKISPMYFASLEVKNVKSFGETQTLYLTDSNGVLSPWTLILGDNGIGKTTLLKCLAWMMPVKFAEPERFQLAKKLKAKIEDVEWIKEITETSDKGWEIISKKLKVKVEEDLKWIKDVTKISDKEWKIILNEDPNVGGIERITPLMDSINEDDINRIIRVGKGVRMSIEVKFTNDVLLNTIPNKENLTTIGISLARKFNKELDEIEDIKNTDHLTTAEVKEFNAPNLFAYSATRHMATENLENVELKEPTYNLFSNSGDLYDAEEVLLKLYNDSLKEEKEYLKKKLEEKEAQMQKVVEQLKSSNFDKAVIENLDESADVDFGGKATKHLRKVKEILVKLLPDIKDADCIIINPSNENEDESSTKIVEVVTSFGKVGLFDLSLGYQTMLAWVVDLAIRMFWQNPESDNPLNEPAVVIVDEIDLHLHPKWQRTLKEYLTSNFENTQFICTAHSPFIAQASEDENLCVLNERKISPATSEVFIENDPQIVKGWHISQIVTNLFGLSDMSWEVEENLINKRRILLEKENRTLEDEENIKNLNEQVLNLPDGEDEDDRKLLAQIRRAAELLRQKGGLND